MIYDCFLFCNELDVLEIRLNELNDVVDRLVLVESAHTFTKLPKPLFFEQNKLRFEKLLPKIEHVIVNNCPGFFISGEFQKPGAMKITR